MAGIYVHIPFCREACYYCDFHFTISIRYLEDMIAALAKEIINRKNYLEGKKLSTIYFGGGTPSLLPSDIIRKLIDIIYLNHEIDNNPEITLEANPDNLNRNYIKELINSGINRLSIGVQSFFDEDLVFLNRIHNARQSVDSIRICQEEGITNINVDLIYAIPGLTVKRWVNNIRKVIHMDVKHLSAYHLTYEQGTILYYRREKGRLKELREETGIKQFHELTERMASAGYEHYEISNFAKEKYISRHNSGYWNQEPYIGIGPSAHSFDGSSRQWNVSRNLTYIKEVKENGKYYEKETPDNKTRYHEYLITALRTKWGADPVFIRKEYGRKVWDHFIKKAGKYLDSGHMTKKEGKICFTIKGMLISDHIIRDMFLN